MRIYRSRIGLEIWLPVAVILGVELFIFVRNNIWPGVLLLLIICALITVGILRTRYTITNDQTLRIQSFFTDKSIPVSSIHLIQKTTNPISSPAASLIGRIEILYDNGKSIIISPSDKQKFISDLLAIHQGILIKD
jgi:hypothetical protein